MKVNIGSICLKLLFMYFQLKDFEGKETAQLVDRYKFLDLYPCTSVELKSIGYSDVSSFPTRPTVIVPGCKKLIKSFSIHLQQTGLFTPKTSTVENEEIVCQLPRPDFSQMIPYKPKSNPYPYEHPLAGGTFPQPPALAALCAELPPPICFRGPFVAVDSLIDVFNRIKLPEGKFEMLVSILDGQLNVWCFLFSK